MDSPLMKRIKRHVLSKRYRFLGVVQPAFRGTARRELEEKGFRVLEEGEGGVEFEGPLQEGWRANLTARSIARVYCRVASFRAGAREELYRKAVRFPWELWINPAIPLRVIPSVRRSRIYHEGVLRDTLLEAIQDRFRSAGLGEIALHGGDQLPQRVLVYSKGSRCVLSLDMSGEGLHRRGYRAWRGSAPIREDLAAALLYELGWRGKGVLCDPMTGSGTFGIEALLMGLGVPPGWKREFLFQQWPSFLRDRWGYVRGKSLGELGTKKVAVFSFDKDPRAVEGARKNAILAGVGDQLKVSHRDFFTLTGRDVEEMAGAGVDEGEERYLVINPPYGKRMEAEKRTHQNLWDHIRTKFYGWRVLVITPENTPLPSATNFGFRSFCFRHGGLRIRALIGVPKN